MGWPFFRSFHRRILFAKCLNDNGFKRLELIGKGAVTFDSPGQPERYRTVGNGFTPQMKKMVTTMNNRPNLVNTLTKPIASEFYCCGRGSELLVSDLSAVINSLFCAVTSADPSKLFKEFTENTNGHKMTRIIEEIKGKRFCSSNPRYWPVPSNRVAKWLLSPANIGENGYYIQSSDRTEIV